MDKGDLTFGLLIAGGIVGAFAVTLGIVYGIVIVAKWAWGS